MKILLIEDEVQVSAFIRQGLQEQQHDVDVVYDGTLGERLGLSRDNDVVILDIVIPGINGFDLCETIKKEKPQLPVLMLTTLSTTTDKLTGFVAGADDYLVKPFEFEELLARLHVLVRRNHTGASQSGSLLRVEDLKLDLEKKAAIRGDKLIKLSAKELVLLEYFMRNAGRVIPRAELAEKIWDITFDTGTNVVEVYINILRNKIDRDFEPKLLHTRIGLGYVLEKEAMKIRAKLTLIFFGIVILVLTGFSISIYYFSANYRETDFQRRLKNRAINVAKILVEVKEVDADLLKRLEQNNPANLPNQYVIIYDTARIVYQSDLTQPITIDSVLLQRIRQEKEIFFHEHMFQVVGFRMDEPGTHFLIIAAASDVYGWDALNNLRNILIIILFASITFSVNLISY